MRPELDSLLRISSRLRSESRYGKNDPCVAPNVDDDDKVSTFPPEHDPDVDGCGLFLDL